MRTMVLVVIAVSLGGCTPREPAALRTPPTTGAERTIVQGPGYSGVVERETSDPAVVALEVAAEPDALWRALPAAFEGVGLKGAGVIDAGTRLFGYPEAVIPGRLAEGRLSAFLDCGYNMGGANADTYRVTGTILALVRPAERSGASIVELRIDAAGKPRSTSGAMVTCRSNGRLERAIAQHALAQATTGS